MKSSSHEERSSIDSASKVKWCMNIFICLKSCENQGIAKSDQQQKINEYRCKGCTFQHAKSTVLPSIFSTCLVLERCPTKPQPPDPPPRSRGIAKPGPGAGGRGSGSSSAPTPPVPFTLCSNAPYSRVYITTSPTHAGPRGGGLPLPAAAAAAP